MELREYGANTGVCQNNHQPCVFHEEEIIINRACRVINTLLIHPLAPKHVAPEEEKVKYCNLDVVSKNEAVARHNLGVTAAKKMYPKSAVQGNEKRLLLSMLVLFHSDFTQSDLKNNNERIMIIILQAKRL